MNIQKVRQSKREKEGNEQIDEQISRRNQIEECIGGWVSKQTEKKQKDRQRKIQIDGWIGKVSRLIDRQTDR